MGVCCKDSVLKSSLMSGKYVINAKASAVFLVAQLSIARAFFKDSDWNITHTVIHRRALGESIYLKLVLGVEMN